MRSEIAGAVMSGPPLQRTEACDALGFSAWIDVAGANHLCEAGHTRNTVSSDAIAIGFGDKLRRECRALSKPELQQNALYPRAQFLKWDTNHAHIRTHRIDCEHAVVAGSIRRR